MYTLVLASESPRRKALLEKAGFSFLVSPSQISEYLEKNLTLESQLLNLARRKAEATLDTFKPLESQDYLFLSADTMVVLGSEPLGKPKDKTEAHDFLKRLSGKTHLVLTSVFVCTTELSGNRLIVKHSDGEVTTTEIVFRELSAREISDYIATGEPMDKAGAYGIQSGGGKFVKEVKGSFDNVVGLPVDTFQKILDRNGWKVK